VQLLAIAATAQLNVTSKRDTAHAAVWKEDDTYARHLERGDSACGFCGGRGVVDTGVELVGCACGVTQVSTFQKATHSPSDTHLARSSAVREERNFL